MVGRLQGWESRLTAVIENTRGKPFSLGENDCFRFTCRVIEALTGIDRWQEFAGYKTERDVLRLISAHGDSQETALDWFFGAPRIPRSFAQRGDIVITRLINGEKALGVVTGVRAVFVAAQGPLEIPVKDALFAWRVG